MLSSTTMPAPRTLRLALLALLLPMLCLVAPPAVHAQLDAMPRAAVIMGNGDYAFAPLENLDNPVNDARAMNGVLRDLRFDVALLQNGDLATMRDAVRQMSRLFPKDGIGLFYYAGHGVQYKGVNYLLPTDFRLGTVEELPERSLALNDVLQAMQQAGVQIGIVVLDACRENPFGEVSDAFGEGLALVDAPGETLIAYATNPGGVAEDGIGPNSPYTSALVSALELPGQDIYDVFRLVRAVPRLLFTLGRALDIAERFEEADEFYRQAASATTARATRTSATCTGPAGAGPSMPSTRRATTGKRPCAATRPAARPWPRSTARAWASSTPIARR